MTQGWLREKFMIEGLVEPIFIMTDYRPFKFQFIHKTACSNPHALIEMYNFPEIHKEEIRKPENPENPYAAAS